MNIDFIKAEHNHRIDRARNEYRRANNPASRPHMLKTVTAFLTRFVFAQRSITSQAPTAAASVHRLAS